MVARAKTPYISPEEYFRLESEAEYRSEYWNGLIVAMAGGSLEHECIADDLHLALGNQLRDTPCRAFRGIAVGIPAHNRYFFPDVSVACKLEYTTHSGIAVLVNPIVVVEVLSKSTGELDFTSKKDSYATLESLAAYVVISQDQPRVEVFVRQPDGILRTDAIITSLDAVVSLPAIGCEVRMAELYRGVQFAAEASNSVDGVQTDEPGSSTLMSG